MEVKICCENRLSFFKENYSPVNKGYRVFLNGMSLIQQNNAGISHFLRGAFLPKIKVNDWN